MLSYYYPTCSSTTSHSLWSGSNVTTLWWTGFRNVLQIDHQFTTALHHEANGLANFGNLHPRRNFWRQKLVWCLTVCRYGNEQRISSRITPLHVLREHFHRSWQLHKFLSTAKSTWTYLQLLSTYPQILVFSLPYNERSLTQSFHRHRDWWWCARDHRKIQSSCFQLLFQVDTKVIATFIILPSITPSISFVHCLFCCAFSVACARPQIGRSCPSARTLGHPPAVHLGLMFSSQSRKMGRNVLSLYWLLRCQQDKSKKTNTHFHWLKKFSTEW